jgi:hypothetical protein
MEQELIRSAQELVKVKGTTVVEIINWSYGDGSGNHYCILTKNGVAYDLHKVGGFQSGYGWGARCYERKNSISKLSKKEVKEINEQCLIKERISL